MVNKKYAVLSFLRKYGMDYESIDMNKNCSAFVKAMEDGLEGRKESLKMIPAYIAMEGEIPADKPVIVIDAGGTNFRTAVVYFDRNKAPVIEGYKLLSMPGTNGEISKHEFYETIITYVSPLLDKSSKIGFCFSYNAEILPNKDGRLIQFSKEFKVKGLEGELIGENLCDKIKQYGYGDRKVVMLNDTVATLLGGKAAYPDRVFDSYIGFILGTGTNTSYIEDNRNIIKIKDSLSSDGSMIINVESGDFKGIKMGVMDMELDHQTNDPGKYTFEKMVSGRYQGKLVSLVIEKAVSEGLFSDCFRNEFNKIGSVTGLEVNDFLVYPYSNNKLSKCCSSTGSDGEDDRAVLYYIIDSIIERAARLVAINLASIIIKTGKGKSPTRPVCITAEGSTFYKSKLFRSRLEYYVKQYINDERELYCEFVKSDDVTLIGTAIAALLN